MSDCDQFRNSSERRRVLGVHLGASGSNSEKPWSGSDMSPRPSDMSGSTLNHS